MESVCLCGCNLCTNLCRQIFFIKINWQNFHIFYSLMKVFPNSGIKFLNFKYGHLSASSFDSG